MGAFADLPAFLGKDLKKVAQELNYSDSNICILEGDEQKLKTRFPNVYSNLISCSHNRDKRTPMEYAQDLVASWIFEDYLMKELNDAGLHTLHAGADRNREILANVKVSSNSDCTVVYQGKSRPMEIMTDYSGWWSRTHKMDLRDSKYNKMNREKALFAGFSTQDGKYLLYDFEKAIDAKYIPYHRPYGNKPAYEITVGKDDLKDFSVESLINEIKEAMG